jgi:hypothetical protein
MPRVITGNTMAACVIIGERAGELLRTAHKLSGSRLIPIKELPCADMPVIPERDCQIRKRSKSQ